MTGIYVVDIRRPASPPDPAQPAGSQAWRGQSALHDRAVVIAPNAQEAEARALAAWRTWSPTYDPQPLIAPTLDVGRLGDYDPGIEGARMVAGAVVLIGPVAA